MDQVNVYTNEIIINFYTCATYSHRNEHWLSRDYLTARDWDDKLSNSHVCIKIAFVRYIYLLYIIEQSIPL